MKPGSWLAVMLPVVCFCALSLLALPLPAAENDEEPEYPHGGFAEDCELCHQAAGWRPVEISDEFDDEDLIFSKIDDTTFIFEGKTSLKDFYKVIKLEDPILFEEVKGDADTLAGLLLEISKGFPKIGEIILFNHYSFTIEGFENKRIKQIKLSIIH